MKRTGNTYPLLYLFIILITTAGCTSSRPLFEPPVKSAAASLPTEIPLKFDHGNPYLAVRIDSVDCEVYLDTGAADVALALLPDVADSLGLMETGGNRRLRTNYGEMSFRRRIAPAVGLGDLTFTDVLCDLQNPDIPAAYQSRGIMGLAMLRPFTVLIDYRAERMVLYNAGTLPAAPDVMTWQRIRLLDEPDGLHISATFPESNRTAKLCLDTGAIAARDDTRFYNILRPKVLDSLGDTEEYGGMRFVESRAVTADGVTLSGLRFLGLDFQEPRSTDGFLGTDFFMRYRVCIDFANERIYVQPYD